MFGTVKCVLFIKVSSFQDVHIFTQVSGASSQGRSSRSKTEEGGEGRRGGGGETREGESPTKQRSLNDPVTVRTNAKKALLQTLWRR